MTNTLFIPQKIKVGYQSRQDTYTKKLAYVIYYDEKGKLRKEPSWQVWRDEKLGADDFDNTPTDGFVLNKKVGGYSVHWGNFRQAYVRVYDPRGFEFEISIPNLLYILEHTSSIKGKGLEGSFVYGWDGTDLVLLPTCSPDYEELLQLNKKRFDHPTIKAKDLKVGNTYLTKRNEKLIYIGRFDLYKSGYVINDRWFSSHKKLQDYAESIDYDLYYYDYRGYRQYNYRSGVGNDGKYYFFYSEERDQFCYEKSVSGKLIDVVSDEIVPNYSELFSKLEHKSYYSPIDEDKTQYVRVTLEELKNGISALRKLPYDYRTYLVKTNGAYATVRITLDDTHLYKCRFTDRDTWKFEYPPIPEVGSAAMTAEELYEKVEFYHKDIYLANGNFYERRY